MVIEVFGDDITKEDVKDLIPRVGARGIVKKDDLYLMVYFEKDGFYTLPGGGVEINESLEAAVIREVKEETGYICQIMKKGVVLKEYFIDSVWHNHYYLLEVVDQTEVALTKEEKDMGLVPVWKTLEEVLDILSSSDSDHQDAEAIHNREFLGFTHSL
ncbi:MAG: NUDIX hydrolase [Candidatus Izemoplasmataceae bacterium]